MSSGSSSRFGRLYRVRRESAALDWAASYVPLPFTADRTQPTAWPKRPGLVQGAFHHTSRLPSSKGALTSPGLLPRFPRLSAVTGPSPQPCPGLQLLERSAARLSRLRVSHTVWEHGAAPSCDSVMASAPASKERCWKVCLSVHPAAEELLKSFHTVEPLPLRAQRRLKLPRTQASCLVYGLVGFSDFSGKALDQSFSLPYQPLFGQCGLLLQLSH